MENLDLRDLTAELSNLRRASLPQRTKVRLIDELLKKVEYGLENCYTANDNRYFVFILELMKFPNKYISKIVNKKVDELFEKNMVNGFLVFEGITDKEVISKDFLRQLIKHTKQIAYIWGEIKKQMPYNIGIGKVKAEESIEKIKNYREDYNLTIEAQEELRQGLSEATSNCSIRPCIERVKPKLDKVIKRQKERLEKAEEQYKRRVERVKLMYEVLLSITKEERTNIEKTISDIHKKTEEKNTNLLTDLQNRRNKAEVELQELQERDKSLREEIQACLKQLEISA